MASEQSFWKNFCTGIDRLDLFEKWPGSTYADHARGNTELQVELRDIFRTKTTSEWLAFADAHNTTIAPINTSQSIIDDPQFADRFDWLSTAEAGCEQLMFPLRIDGEELPRPARAPDLGQHTDEILGSLGES
jgi:crotonobetainyl-CoA:carnitine CoA-transferase CaiB-like acyl-CoA transferase